MNKSYVDRPFLSYYRVDYRRHGNAAVAEWLAFVACMAEFDMDRNHWPRT